TPNRPARTPVINPAAMTASASHRISLEVTTSVFSPDNIEEQTHRRSVRCCREEDDFRRPQWPFANCCAAIGRPWAPPRCSAARLLSARENASGKPASLPTASAGLARRLRPLKYDRLDSG